MLYMHTQLQQLNDCRRKNNTTTNVAINTENQSVVVQEDLIQQDQEHEKFTVKGSVYQKDLAEVYEQIIHQRKNVFMVPTGEVQNSRVTKPSYAK